MVMLPSGLANVVADDEDLARFLTSSRQFNTVMVKPSAFLPSPKDGATSVFRHGTHPLESLWQLAIQYVLGDRTLHGVAVFKARHVRSASLEVAAQEPPPRHANIVGWLWSSTDPELERAEQKERALLIAQHAEFIRR